MKVIILIAVSSLMLYKAGVARWFLQKCQIEGDPVPFPSWFEDIEIKKPELIEDLGPLITNTAQQEIEAKAKTREQLEIQAAYIVGRQGHNPATVKYMGEDLLQALIRDYIKAANE